MSKRVACPHCDAIVRVGPIADGAVVRCPACNGTFTPDAQPSSGQGAKRSAEPASDTLFSRDEPSDADAIHAAGALGKRVPTMLCGLYALLISMALIWAAQPMLADTAVGRLFSHGLISFFTLWLSIWAGWILVIKAVRLGREKRALGYDVLSREEQALIRPSNVHRFRTHLQELPKHLHTSILYRRISGALEFFRSTRSADGVASYLAAQNELDGESSESSFTMVRAFIWAIPILGFIGTVFGIGEAVSSFAVSVDSATDVEAIRTSLGGVTGGLGTAFETTLVALIMSILLMIPTNWIQKTEDDLLTGVARYCNEELGWRFERTIVGGSSEGGAAASSGDLESVSERVEGAADALSRSAGLIEKQVDASIARLGDALPSVMSGVREHFEQTLRSSSDLVEAQRQMQLRFAQAAEGESLESLMVKISETHERMLDVYQKLAEAKPRRWWRR